MCVIAYLTKIEYIICIIHASKVGKALRGMGDALRASVTLSPPKPEFTQTCYMTSLRGEGVRGSNTNFDLSVRLFVHLSVKLPSPKPLGGI